MAELEVQIEPNYAVGDMIDSNSQFPNQLGCRYRFHSLLITYFWNVPT